MSKVISSSLTSVRIAYQLILHSKISEAKRNKNTAIEKAARTALDEDMAEISDAGKSAKSSKVSSGNVSLSSDVQITLSDLIAKLQEITSRKAQISQETQENNANQSTQTTLVNFQQTVETQISLYYVGLEKIRGLVVNNKTTAETDRYKFEFLDACSLKILDKWNGLSTTVWGDPHVDTSDEAGNYNGEFCELTESCRYTTFMLLDDTRVTITAPDDGYIENVDIFKGTQHLTAIGLGSKDYTEANGLFADSVESDASRASKEVPLGDVVYAGGDGNDWYDADGDLVWGQTTQTAVTSRPSGYYEMQYSQTVTQQLSVVQVNSEQTSNSGKVEVQA